MGQRLWLSIDNHLHGKVRTKLGKSKASELCSANLLRLNAKGSCIHEKTHYLLVIQWHSLGIHTRAVLQKPYHGRIIVSQNIEL